MALKPMFDDTRTYVFQQSNLCSNYHLADGDVVWLGRNGVEELKREADAQGMGMWDAREKTIVIATASSQTMTLTIESHTGNKG